MNPINLEVLQDKWKKKWQDHAVFEPEVDERKKYFVTFPYPYLNGYLHVGHLYTWSRCDVMARFKRHQGYNVLFPQAWHGTGSALMNESQRVKDKEPIQMGKMKLMGFSEEESQKFEDPAEWLRFFPAHAKKDLIDMGLSIDWRREFITTDLNPYYDKFIRWQFNTLREKGYVGKGKHPVVWDPKLNMPVGDHDRTEGEGETPQEFTLLKFPFENDEFIICATLRPETVFGQTNLWVGSDNTYVRARVSPKGKKQNAETWILSKEATEKLSQQDKEVEIISEIKGKDLIGKKVLAPGVNREIIILPSTFCDTSKGTGIVTSVPSDAPDDWMGLFDLQQSEEECKKHGLGWEAIKNIKPIPIIDTDMGDMAAVKICEDMEIKSQKDRGKLDKAKKIVYKKGFYEGTMNSNCGEYSGMKVEDAKEKVKTKLLKSEDADLMYELTGQVVSRALTECIVKIVDDQWFVKYSDKEWKKKTHQAFKNIKLFPEKSRSQFDYTIDWLNDWACTRERGQGTKLPWDEKWLIESLSDSTMYMSFYTICHILNKIDIEKVDDSLFDYVFYGKEGETKIEKQILDSMRKEFEYWYPVDFRNSGKDLLQNHLTFYVFTHVAMFPEDKWPKGIGVNGWVLVDGQKMSKSLGNFIPLKDMGSKYGSDASRLTELSGGEGMDDPNFDTHFAVMVKAKLEQLYKFSLEYYNKGTDITRRIDLWMESQLNEIIRDTTHFMEETMYRSASQRGFFDLQRVVKWYLRRCGDKPNKEIMKKIIESQLVILAPFAPFICEETWEQLGKDSFVSLAEWPGTNEDKILENVDEEENLVRNIVDDIRNLLKLVKVDANKITLFVSEDWKYDLYERLKSEIDFTSKIDIKEIISSVMGDENLKKHGQDVMKIINKVIKTRQIPRVIEKETESTILTEARDFLEDEFGVDIAIINAEDSEENKAKSSLPGKPAILIG
jgi:leucyl-tRNA synthetase